MITPDAALGVLDMFDYLKKKFKKAEPLTPIPSEAVKQLKKERAKKPAKSAKDLATEAGEPYVAILSVELDPENIGNGAFELDWNDKFITNLVRAGYQQKAGEEETVIVDRWFADVCKNVLSENFEQWEANQPYDNRPRNVDRKDLGNGKTEVS
jgi:hypothetical protein